MKKTIRKNYRFDYATDYNLRRLVEMTGKTETEIVEEAIARYFKVECEVQESLAKARAIAGL